jgi:hypothetical protein
MVEIPNMKAIEKRLSNLEKGGGGSTPKDDKRISDLEKHIAQIEIKLETLMHRLEEGPE